MKKLNQAYYLNDNVVDVAKDLIGKSLCTLINGLFSKVIITETEAYAGITDKASHAYGGRFTNRTKTMYKGGGIAYVYLCYGIHHLFNIVTNTEGTPHAVLIRGGVLVDGEQIVLKRRNKTKLTSDILIGPGKLSQGLGINTKHNGINLTGEKIWLEYEGVKINSDEIETTPRIGIDYAEEDKYLPYRFVLSPKIISL